MRLEEILAPVSSDLDAVERRLEDWAEACGGVGRAGALPVVSEAVRHILRSGGKRLRPACLLLAASLGDQDEATREKAVELATTVEVIHTASLVHDDIVDEAPVRRGGPTLHARWGRPLALLVGDLLYSRLFSSLASEDSGEPLRVVAETVHKMVLGELAETVRRDDLGLSESEYFDIVRNKTSALFSCATYLGAWAGGLPREDCARLRLYGRRLGTAFQVVDDLLDICEEDGDLGKPAGADLREGRVTLPVIHALRRDARRGPVRRLFSERDRNGLRTEVSQGGSLAYAVGKAEEAATGATSCLEGLSDGRHLRALVGVAEYIVARGQEAASCPAVASAKAE